jgi:hypothetical protein
MLSRSWYETTIFYEGFDEPNTGYTFGMVLDDPNAPSGYDKKPVFDLLHQVVTNQPLFGGNGFDCSDGLDNDGDGKVDFPDDVQCANAMGPSETGVVAMPDLAMTADGGAGSDAAGADAAIPGTDAAGPVGRDLAAGGSPDLAGGGGAGDGGGCAVGGRGRPFAGWALLLLVGLARRRRAR